MGVTARDLYFVLRVRDEASGVLNGVSRDILRVGAAAQASSARAEAAALRQQAANVRSLAAQRVETDLNAASQLRQQAAQMKAAGATKQQTSQLIAQAQAHERNAAQTQRDADKEVASLTRSAKAWDAYAANMENTFREHQRLAQSLRDVSSALSLVGVALLGVGAVGAAALLSTVKAAVEYQRQVALTKTQVDGFSASLKQIGDVGKQAARDIAVPFEAVQPALYDIFSSTNANLKQATILLQAFSKAAVAGQVSIEDAGRSTMGIMNAFKIPFEDVNIVLDKQFQLVRKGVGTYGQFANVIGKLTPSAVRLGQNLDTMDAVLVFLTRNGLSAASAVAAGARAMDALANPNTTHKLDALGIASRDATGKFLPLVDILKNMRKYLLSLPPPDRAKALFDIFKGSGGTIQAKRFFDLVLPTAKGPGNLDQFIQFLDDMKNSTGQFQQAYNQMANTTASKTQVLKNNWKILQETAGEILMPVLNKLIDIISQVMQWFNKLPDSTQRFIVQAALVATAVSIIGGAILLLLGGLGMLASSLAALGLSLGTVLAVVAGGTALIVGLGLAFAGAYMHSQDFRNMISDIGTTLSNIYTNDIVPFVDNVEAAFDKQLKPALDALWQVINLNVIPAFHQLSDYMGSHAIKDVKNLLNTLQDAAKQGFHYLADIINQVVIPTINTLTTFYYKHKTGIDQVVGGLMSLLTWMGKVAGGSGFILLITAIGGAILIMATMVNGVVAVITVLGKLITWLHEAYDWLNKWGLAGFHAGEIFKNGISTALDGALGLFGALPGKIQAAISGLPGILFGAGQNMIDGLINGVKSKIGTLTSLMGWLGILMQKTKGPPAKDKVMLKPAGQLIMQGLMAGIQSMVPMFKDQLQSITKDAQTSATASVTAARGPVVSSRNTDAANVRYNNVTVNYYQPTTSPRYTAEQIGSLLVGRIG